MLRKKIFQFTTFAIIALTIFIATTHKKALNKNRLSDNNTVLSSSMDSLEEKAFSMQSKLILSIMNLLNSQKAISNQDKENTRKTLINSSKSFLQFSNKDKKYLRLKKIIFSQHLGLDTKELCSNSKEEIAKNICNKKKLNLNEQESKRLSWFLKLYQKKQALDQNTLAKFGIGFMLIISVIMLSCIVFSFYLLMFLFKRPKSNFKLSSINSDYCLEIFCLYLIGMNLLPFLLLKINYSPLKLNVIGISSLTLLVFWPLLFKQKFAEIRQSLGLTFKDLPKNILIGFSGYFASILPLLAVLSVYSVILLKLGVDVEQGAHPIVPIITQSKNSATIYIIFILAVIVAPIIEEIMFRGAFYSWLRDRINAPLSILVSSLIFAAIHPQGAVGIIPLTFIGIVLAILREWRGSIVPSIFAHACFNAGTLILVTSAFK